ncbi:MAG: aminoglycoside phosphotransferase family protein [Anaerolineae bacterium]|nr:aminoglycoside phosphotransferase family protein [Anaerolineae bacterium]
MDDSEILTGGNSNQVMRQGRTVVRRTGVWSPFVHQLLRFLTAEGFQESPVLLESSDSQERLTYIEGDVGQYPLKPYMQMDAVLVESARLLRRFHDLTAQFVVPPDAQFFLPVDPNAPYEGICHNDFAPYNCVYQDGHLVGVIDFDTASPGLRVWDVAYAVYRFVPLTNDAHTRDCGWEPIPDRGRRLKLFCDAYGLDGARRKVLVPTVIQRLQAMVDYMTRTASNPEHIPLYITDMAYLRENQVTLTTAIKG